MQATKTAIILAIALVISTALLGYFFERSVERYRSYERSIEVKGLAEQEVPADIAIWPVQFSVTADNLTDIYSQLDVQHKAITEFLLDNGFNNNEITSGTPAIVDKKAQTYGNYNAADIRFTASQTLTVYSENIQGVRDAQTKLVDLGKKGILLSGDPYSSQTQYLFSGLNDLKPMMIEQATQKAREVASKFAEDSASRLGKIKQARQGQFSISDRDSNTPYIKQVRVVSTVEYYLVD